MAQRVTSKASFELFPTPPFATRAVIEEELRIAFMIDEETKAWDPACGAGHMAIPMKEYFGAVFSSDITDQGYGDNRALDFGFATTADCPIGAPDWVMANPPFRLAEMFIDKALTIATTGVAMFMRLQFIEGGGRYNRLFSKARRPRFILPFAERVALIEDVWDPEASSATAYAWFIWDVRGSDETVIRPIPPGCAARYTKLSDMALATPGEARRRKAARKAAEAK
jgi:hypothetical protein